MALGKRCGRTALLLALLALGGWPALARAGQEYKHPQLYVNENLAEEKTRFPYFGWGTVLIKSEALKNITCVTLMYGTLWNEKVAGAETEKTYGEVLEWTGTGYVSKSFLEPSPRCLAEEGFEAWGAVEPPISFTTQIVKVKNSEGGEYEQEVYKNIHREPPSVPWNQEAIGELTSVGKEVFKLKTGFASTTCYGGTELSERAKNATEKETEIVLKPVPQGCLKINIIVPEFGFEIVFEGTLYYHVVNGVHNGLSPTLLKVEGSEERLESVFGRAQVQSEVPLHLIGFSTVQLLTVGAR